MEIPKPLRILLGIAVILLVFGWIWTAIHGGCAMGGYRWRC